MIAFIFMRKRKAVTYRIDEAVIEAFKEMALDQNLSANRLLENYLFDLAKTKGYLKKDLKPIGETRGGAINRGDKDDD